MKKILLHIILIFLSLCLKAQTYPLIQNIASGSTKLTIPNYGALYGGMIPLSFSDTSAANTALTYGKNYAGFLIFTTTERSLWYRDITGNRWVMVLPSGSPVYASAWVYNGNNLASYPDSAVLGTTSNTDWFLIANNLKFLKINKGGIQPNSGSVVNLGVNMSTGDLSFGSSGTTPTWQQTLTAGSTLNVDNTVTMGNSDFFKMIGSGSSAGILIDQANITTSIGDVNTVSNGTIISVIDNNPGVGYFTSTGTNAKFGINTTSPDSALKVVGGIYGTRGLRLSSLTNLSTQNRLLGQFGTDGNVGYITLGSGLSLVSGVLDAVAPVATTWNAIANPTGDQALTFDAGESTTWTNSNTTEDLFTVNSSTMTTSSLFSLNSTSTTLASGNNLVELLMSGANGTNGITATGARISVTNTNATSGTNVGLNVTASGATTGNYAILATGRVGIDQTTPTAKLQINTDANSVTQSDANGILLANATAAINGTQSISPPLILQGNGWATGVNNSQDVRFREQVLPVQAATNPTGTWQLQSSINGGAYTNRLTVSSNGTFSTSGSGMVVDGSGNTSVVLLAASTQLLTSGGSSAIPYRTTNAGSNVTPVFYAGAPATNTAGTLGFAADVTNGFSFTAANGTRQIARAAINITNLVNTAASESADLSFYVQAAGAAMAQRLVLASAGDLTLGGAATAPQLRLLEGSAGGTNYAGFQSPATLAGNTVYTLPTAFPAGTYLMQSSSAGALSFIDPATIPGTFALTNGNGTTANGTAVDLGGTLVADMAIDGNYNFDIGRSSAVAQFRVGVSGGIELNGGSVQMNAYGAGAATFDASGNISSVSDIRLKNKRSNYSGGLKELMQINPIIYKWKPESGMETKHDYIGFSAQNIRSSLGEDAIGINKQGYLSIQDRAILAAAINAIQELKELNDKQQKEINNLKQIIKMVSYGGEGKGFLNSKGEINAISNTKIKKK